MIIADQRFQHDACSFSVVTCNCKYKVPKLTANSQIAEEAKAPAHKPKNCRTDLPGPVWPVHWTGLTGRGCSKTSRPVCLPVCLPVWPVAPRKPPKTWIQTMNLNQTTMKIDETWGIASPLPCEHIPKRSRPKDQRILRIMGEIKKDWGFLKNSRNSILKSSWF